MIAALVSLLICPFLSIHAMEQSNTPSGSLVWDIQGTYFANYALQFRPPNMQSLVMPPHDITYIDQSPQETTSVVPFPTYQATEEENTAENNTNIKNLVTAYAECTQRKLTFIQAKLSTLDKNNQVLFLKAVFHYELNRYNTNKDPSRLKLFLTAYVPSYFPVDIFRWNEHGDKILHLAAREKSLALVEYLIKNLGADCNVRNDQNQTPFDILPYCKNATYKNYAQLGYILKPTEKQ